MTTEFIHEPWLMSDLDQTDCGVSMPKDYPLPIIDHLERARQARKKIWGHRKNAQVKAERDRILQTHTRSRKRVQA